MKGIGITTDCVCDLPEDYLKANDIELMYFYITTDSGKFRDGYVITSDNILEYLEQGGTQAETHAPSTQEYKDFFERHLDQYDELIHIAISGQVGVSCYHAMEARRLMGARGQRVTVVDSQNLSTGMGYLVMKAAELRDNGQSAAEITEELIRTRGNVSTTFITRNADYLSRNGKVSKWIGSLGAFLMIHPVLALKKGRISLQMIRIGNYERSVIRYVRGVLKHSGRIANTRLFITHAGCTVKMIAQIRAEVDRLCPFAEIIVTQTSATVSSNCGPGTVGVMFIHK